jgi:hypothetical protein
MRVLHALSQRPSLTGSGITLEAMVRHGVAAGLQQRVVVGVPAGDPHPPVGDLSNEHVHPLVFEKPPLDFALPGMSDVMQYPSSRYSDLSDEQTASYRQAWSGHLRSVIEDFKPDVIHSHHL